MYTDAIIEESPDEPAREYCVSIDYGTMNAFAAILWVKRADTWYAEKEYYYSGRETGYFMCIYIIITFFVKNINTDVPAELVLVRCLFECRDFIDQQIDRLGLKNIEIQVCCLKKLLTRYCFLRRVRKAGINILLQRIFFRICRYRKRRNEAYFRQGNTAEGKRRGCKK